MNTYTARYNLNDGAGDYTLRYFNAESIESAIAHVRKSVPTFRKAPTKAIAMPGHISDRYELAATKGRWAEVWQIAF
jgi:hypothetical protein